MQPTSLAFLWHQHQPYYPDDVERRNVMPWVRFHGIKDYYGMALHIKEVPEFRCTINITPCLLKQIVAYTDAGASDRHLDISRLPADSLSADDGHYLLDHFFMANVDTMIRPHKRYHELFLKRGAATDSAARALRRFSPRDLRDLQVWSNLAWFHGLAFHHDSDLNDFLKKGQDWSEADKQWLLDKQREILARVIPLHRELQEGGQVELTTSPFFHPILPLLWEKKSAHEAMHDCPLPQHLDSYQEDAGFHLQRAVDLHTQVFGRAPRGMWPSEGSVSQAILPAIADVGIEWIATDEEVLTGSTDGWIARDSLGHVNHPDKLYQPWRVGTESQPLQIVFRDHVLSDLIGFHYQRFTAQEAVRDLIGRIESVGRSVEEKTGNQRALLPIILDGENCWEYYADGGVEFLRRLFREAAASKAIQPVRMAEHLHEFPATDRIVQLFAGSWISHNFAIWIGDEETNTAWDHLHETREFLIDLEARQSEPADKIARAWEEIHIAEGSDWFWWFGDDHSSAQDGLFDQLFRKHLQNVYVILGYPVPAVLMHPIRKHEARLPHTCPTGFLDVSIDGTFTFFEWITAGHYVGSGRERGTMALATQGAIKAVYFGFDVDRLFIRVDTPRNARSDLAPCDELQIRFLAPAGGLVIVRGFQQDVLGACLEHNGKVVETAELEVAVNRIFEISIRFADLGVAVDDPVHFRVDIVQNGQIIDQAPPEGALELTVPSADFEMIMWQV